MVTTMTRAEYEKIYGSAPVLPTTSKIDTTPAPRRMTQAEYDAEYGEKTVSEKTLAEKTRGIVDLVNEFNPLYQIPKMAIEGGVKTGESIGRIFTAKTPEVAGKEAISAMAGGVQGLMAIPFGTFEAATNLPGVKQIKNFLWGTEPGTLPYMIADNPTLQETLLKPLRVIGEKYESSPEVASDLITIAMGLSGLREVGKPEFKTKVAEVKTKAIEPLEAIRNKIDTGIETLKVIRDERAVNALDQEILDIQNNYSKTRKANEFSSDEGSASRKRIAQTDVLVDSVDTDGTIRTKQKGGAVDKYKKLTIDGVEGVVRDNLVREGKKVNLAEVRRDLVLEISRSGLEGADLITALNGVEKEIAGLQLRADEFGNVPLEKIHDAKISTTRNIDYNTPAETKAYRKAIARSYKTIVENKSSLNVNEINQELSKYYKDIETLENLDGKKVKGGRLGKYAAQITGTVTGAVVGGAVGGGAGSAIGSVVGGEISSALKGESMASTFGRERGVEIPKNPILEKARVEAGLPPKWDLTIPDERVGVTSDIPKTEEVFKLEREISDNIEAQKRAIAQKNFTLVEGLKQIYAYLVAQLKAVIKKYKETPNKEGGFIKNPLSTPLSESEGLRQQGQLERIESSPDTTTHLKEAQEALRSAKGLSAQDIMSKHPDIQLKRDVPVTDIYGKKAVIPEGEALTPYELKGNKVLLQDGETYIVSKNQYQNIKGQAITGEAKPFAPELEGVEEVVSPINKSIGRGDYTTQTLPGGENYKEVLIKSPIGKETLKNAKGEVILEKSNGNVNNVFKSSHWEEPNVISHLRLNERTYNGKKVTFMEELQSDWAREGREKGLIESNEKLDAELLMLEKQIKSLTDKYPYTVKGSRPDNIQNEIIKLGDRMNEITDLKRTGIPSNPLLKNWQELSVKRALKEAADNNSEYFAWINGEQTSARYNLATHLDNVKWGGADMEGGKYITRNVSITPKGDKTLIKINVDNNGVIKEASRGSDWQGKKLDEVLGKGLADSIMSKESGTLSGEGLKFGGEWANNLYDKQVGNIVKDLTGAKIETLDMGLPIGKDAPAFYSVQNNGMSGGLITNKDIKVGTEIRGTQNRNNYIITDILGDGKFKAVPKDVYEKAIARVKDKMRGNSDPNYKFTIENVPGVVDKTETFDISQKTTTQQGIKLTPEIRAKIKGEAIPIKKPSGKEPFNK